MDGVLTDGAFWWGPNGEEWKRFTFADIMGISLARKAGLIIALISGEDTPLIDRYAAKMGITDVWKGQQHKAPALHEFAARRGLDFSTICFMGDDLNDLEALRLAGLSAAPSDARSAVLEMASFVSTHSGGNGAVRDLIDHILAARNSKA